jgi:hypothetical protein
MARPFEHGARPAVQLLLSLSDRRSQRVRTAGQAEPVEDLDDARQRIAAPPQHVDQPCVPHLTRAVAAVARRGVAPRGQQTGLLPHAQRRRTYAQVRRDLSDQEVRAREPGRRLRVLCGEDFERVGRLAQGTALLVERGVTLVDEGEHPRDVAVVQRQHDRLGGVGAVAAGQGPVGEQGAAVPLGELAVAGFGA